MEQLLDQVNQTTDVVPFAPTAQHAAEEQRVKRVERQEEYGGLIKCQQPTGCVLKQAS